MLKKFLWLTILVLITACTIYISSGSLNLGEVTKTPTLVPTSSEVITATAELTAEATATTIVEDTIAPTATATATATEIASATPTLIPATATVVATATATSIPSPTPTPTATAIPMAFDVQSGTPAFLANFVHADAACNWQGVAGQVFDSTGNSLINYIVKITGKYNGNSVSSLAVTGTVSGNPYGPGSYEIVLGTTAVDSADLLSIQVFDSTGKAVSNALKFSTSSDCTKNLVLINFKAN
jgi:hypothetical protein